ncbi:urease [Vibrio sp. 10N.286.49.C2]|uniref:RNA-binding S4 domain-containing protein n=1 Tax=unclassified Vibrio TaxID=2614977 RepID=UPI000C82152B|nr:MULTISPECIES: RNA-binding S4 domain-containing protein [unclassified Vibrio]PMH38148.1 urease [Vibrio sp. 10N.286.49.C2]PMH53646.1 urease [Vibrio sp. 10N.286.49.B1]
MNEEQFDENYEEEAIEIEALGIEVSSHPIELYKLFKVANLVGGGGEAKHFISEGYVAVNGELETRKRRKMYDGDFFEFNQEYYVVVCDQPPLEPTKDTDKKESKKAATKESKQNKATQNKATKRSSKKNASSKNDPAKQTGSKLSASANKTESKSKKGAKSKPADSANTKNTTNTKSTPNTEKTKSKDPNSGRGGIDFF